MRVSGVVVEEGGCLMLFVGLLGVVDVLHEVQRVSKMNFMNKADLHSSYCL